MGLDKAYFAELLAIAGTLSTDFYTGYVRLSIDLANLRSAVRCLRGHMDEGVLRAAVIPGGNAAPERVLRVYAEGVTAVFDDRAAVSCAELGQQAVEGAPLAPEAVIAYLASLEGEITAARMVLLGKRGGLTPEALRERLRVSYV